MVNNQGRANAPILPARRAATTFVVEADTILNNPAVSLDKPLTA
jgi:hypothetical protein